MNTPPKDLLQLFREITEIHNYLKSAACISFNSAPNDDYHTAIELRTGCIELQETFESCHKLDYFRQTVLECWKASKRIEEGLRQERISASFTEEEELR